MSTVGLAIVGLGWWGSTLVSTLLDSDVIRPVLGVDTDPARRDAVEALGVRVTDSFEAALADPEVEAVLLATPHFLHGEQVVAVAKAGKHVFSEKPFTVTSAEAKAALDAAREAGVKVGIGHERRFEPPVEEMKRLLETGELGTPLVFEGNFSQDKFLSLPPDSWRLSAELAPVGPLSATGIHMVDLAIGFLGEPKEVWARLGTLATGFGNGDTLTITIGFASGATASISAVLSTPFIARACLMGSKGWYEIRDLSHPENSTGWETRFEHRGSDRIDKLYPAFSGVKENLERFGKAIRGGKDYPIGMTDIQHNVDAFEAIVRSAHSGRIEQIG
jgi:predicted dehydrogenase